MKTLTYFSVFLLVVMARLAASTVEDRSVYIAIPSDGDYTCCSNMIGPQLASLTFSLGKLSSTTSISSANGNITSPDHLTLSYLSNNQPIAYIVPQSGIASLRSGNKNVANSVKCNVWIGNCLLNVKRVLANESICAWIYNPTFKPMSLNIESRFSDDPNTGGLSTSSGSSLINVFTNGISGSGAFLISFLSFCIAIFYGI
ncbi:2293_t:CDS:2 [Paraglomus brasilianum]|uniref:2293_t:CDS:1 n=1 Tax=Paraglomus brasilianum TaxID=144538 RepID=A0A9N9C9J1_9GLOM|nr:2293_t:CDS:2 [Paraglomus brasilianum]